MKFSFGRECQNKEESSSKEWILVNGIGGYVSSNISLCNTRKYHGLLNVNLAKPVGRYVLLSALDESVCIENKECFISTHNYDDITFPKGYKHAQKFKIKTHPVFEYQIGSIKITREILMLWEKDVTLIKYRVHYDDIPTFHNNIESHTNCDKEYSEGAYFKITPLCVFRNMHTLSYENSFINKKIDIFKTGFSITPYPDLPTLFVSLENETKKQETIFKEKFDWYKKVCYLKEKERGFEHFEDLWTAGNFYIPLQEENTFYFAASTEKLEESLSVLWQKELDRRKEEEKDTDSLINYLKYANTLFLSKTPQGESEIIAGYPWFQAWGRDTLISINGICFAAGRIEKGKDILKAMIASMDDIPKNAKEAIKLIPNMLSADKNHSFNSIDASLWFVYAVQTLEKYAPQEEDFIKNECYPAIKEIIQGIKDGKHAAKLNVFVTEDNLLYAGNKDIQLTWMDANVHGKPVTPRYGFAVEINALWYNALAYCVNLEKKYNLSSQFTEKDLENIRTAFRKTFWTEYYGGYLADVCDKNGLDSSIRPNQLFAISLPYPVLTEHKDRERVINIVRNNLLTPYGLRTLAPISINYRGRYEGNGEERDSAYHQGTVWPWLLGAYIDALLITSTNIKKDIMELLSIITSLFTTQLCDAGIGSISEIFSGDYPYKPDGCPFQAWSVAECYRGLQNIKNIVPEEYTKWEESIDLYACK